MTKIRKRQLSALLLACNAPATFQRLMELVFSGLHWTSCLVYLDEIIIFSKTVNEHLRQLEEVLDRLCGAGLKAKPSKCQVFRKSVQCLRHVVSEKGKEVDFEKGRVIAQWPVPSCQQEIKKFLGFASYYRQFIPNFAKGATLCTTCVSRTELDHGLLNVKEHFVPLNNC